jgi:hypothetical protein
MHYYFLAGYIAQVYIINSDYIPKGSVIKFPLPVKTYTPQLFSSYSFNNIKRPTSDAFDYIVGTEFVLKDDVVGRELIFYLNSDVKVPKEYVLSKYRVIYLTPKATIPVNMTIDKILAIRSHFVYTSATATIPISINCDIQPVKRYALSITANINLSANAELFKYGFITVLGNIPVNVDAVLKYECCCWDNIDAWDDIDTWADISLTCLGSVINTTATIPLLGDVVVVGIKSINSTTTIPLLGKVLVSNKVGVSTTATVYVKGNATLTHTTPINAIATIPTTGIAYVSKYSTMKALATISVSGSATIERQCGCWGNIDTWGDIDTWS